MADRGSLTMAFHERTAGALLNTPDFQRLSSLIYRECGIKMPEAKRTMLEARLNKRLRALSLHSFTDYCNYLFSKEGMEQELTPMIDLVTTNKTDFFREPDHFDFLYRTALPDLLVTEGAGVRRNLLIWSSACSTGEEPYTLAMVANEFGETQRGYRFSVLATDISTRVLEAGRLGVYDEERVVPIPQGLKRKYVLRSKDRTKHLVKMSPDLRSLVIFRRLNLMDEEYPIQEGVDIIFCRNVVIYFDRRTQEQLVAKLCRYLSPRGYLFMGHSENLHGLDLPLVQVAPTVYRKTG